MVRSSPSLKSMSKAVALACASLLLRPNLLVALAVVLFSGGRRVEQLLLVLLDHPVTENYASSSHVRALPVERHHMVAVVEDNQLRKAPEFRLQANGIADVALVIKTRVKDQRRLLDLA